MQLDQRDYECRTEIGCLLPRIVEDSRPHKQRSIDALNWLWGGEIIQDSETLLKVCTEHFKKLGESRLGGTPEMTSLKDKSRLMAEHLKAGGDVVIAWLIKIINDVVVLEVVREVLKSGVIVPIYKRGRKDPLKLDCYRGITLTSMLSKVLEFLLLKRLELVFMEAGLPHINQSAYRKAVS